MKIPHTRAALTRYDLARADEDHRLDPVLPENPGRVHAIDLKPHRSYQDAQLDWFANRREIAFDRYGWTAECGARVKVAMPFDFNTGDEDACPGCKHWLELKAADPGEYRKRRAEYRRDQLERMEEQAIIDEHRTQTLREATDTL